MDFKNIAIIGVGLIGGSFALALKKRGFKGTVTGIGHNRDNLGKARDLGIIDDFSTDHAAGVSGADLILLAAPVGQFESIAQTIKSALKPGSIVTDAGSVKSEIINRVEPLMPEGVHFIAGHPIAGKEDSGISAADADLFNNAQCIITPGPKTDNTALEKIITLWQRTGAKTVLMDADEHDKIFAAVSHLPHIISYALVNTLIKEDSNVLGHGGGGLKDMIRIASSPAELWRDICSYNKDHILRALKNFSDSIFHMTELIEKSDWKNLEIEFKNAREAKQLIESDQGTT